MNTSSAEDAVRAYLAAVKDPSSMRDDEALSATKKLLDEASDTIERLRLQQQLLTLESPTLDTYEDAFVTHAKAWADEHGISGEAFAAEGVEPSVLRRAGFSVGGRGRRRAAAAPPTARRRRVTTEEVVVAMPSGAFTTKQLGELSGASPAVVRKAITSEQAAGRLVEAGNDPDHSGPGRAPMLYRKS